MFQPQPTTYYSSFPSYGLGNPILDFPAIPSAATGGPFGFRNSLLSLSTNANANASLLTTPFHNNHNYNQHRQPYKMEPPSDFEEQEALARGYNPVLEGPAVGEKKSSHAITEEYAKADPIFVAKTIALPQTYSHYRPIHGDGNCGWRAIGFSYFETLVKLGSQSKLEEETARIMSLNNLITTVGGFQLEAIEDFIDEMLILLKDLEEVIQTPAVAIELITQRWSNTDNANAMLYHLRLLASSWLKGHPDLYVGFIPDQGGPDAYSKSTLEPPYHEIDHLGMSLVIDVLLKPIGVAVEIVYLDRSQGSNVNTHVFQAEDSNGFPMFPGGPVIHLLYRPGHYDVLYKDSTPLQPPMIEAVQHSNIQVNRATSFSQQHNIQSTMSSMHGFSNSDMSLLLSLPGFAPSPSHHGFAQSQYSPIDHPYAASPISASLSPVTPGLSSITSNLTLSANFDPQSSVGTSPISKPVPSPHATYSPMTQQLPIHPHNVHQPHPLRPSLPSMISYASDLPSPMSANTSFRPSKYEWEAAADWQEPVSFQTSTFKNSHYNVAHYNNPDFQPLQWDPDGEEIMPGSGHKKIM